RRRDVLRRGLDVRALIVEEEIGTERTQELALVEPAEKERLVDADIPGAKRADHALMRRRAARGDERGADRALVLGGGGLDVVQRGQKILEWAAGKRVARGVRFAPGERVKPAGLIHAFSFVGEDDGIAVEGNPQLVGLVLVDAGKDGRRSITVVKRALDVFR